MCSKAYKALRLVGGRSPFYKSIRGSYALVGSTGPGRRRFWMKQVSWNICAPDLWTSSKLYHMHVVGLGRT